MPRRKILEGTQAAALDAGLWTWVVIVNDGRLAGFIDRLITQAREVGETTRKVSLAGGAFEVRATKGRNGGNKNNNGNA